MSIGNTELEKVIERAQKGDKEAFRRLFDVLSNRLYAYSLSRIKDYDDVIDLLQDVFMDLWIALPALRYKNDEMFFGFVFTITKRKISGIYKSRRKREAENVYEIFDKYEIEREDYRYLIRNVEKLSPKFQEVIRLRYWSDMTFAEMGGIMGARESTVKVWHHRALNNLGKLINKSKYE